MAKKTISKNGSNNMIEYVFTVRTDQKARNFYTEMYEYIDAKLGKGTMTVNKTTNRVETINKREYEELTAIRKRKVDPRDDLERYVGYMDNDVEVYFVEKPSINLYKALQEAVKEFAEFGRNFTGRKFGVKILGCQLNKRIYEN